MTLRTRAGNVIDRTCCSKSVWTSGVVAKLPYNCSRYTVARYGIDMGDVAIGGSPDLSDLES